MSLPGFVPSCPVRARVAAIAALALSLPLAACKGPWQPPMWAGSAMPPPPTQAEQIRDFPVGSGVWRGYLMASDWPDGLALLPPPPKPGLPPYLADEYMFESTRELAQGPRGELARQDADLSFPHAPNQFACALGLDIQPERSPHLNALMRRSFADAGLATYKAKNYYQRVRPFVVNHTSTCLPADDAQLAKDGSYPSGHTSVGWAWALILSEVAPERSNALLQRGLAFGQSRVICGAHWQSDVDNGRLIGAGVVARLQTEPVFQAQLALAREEVAQLRKTVSGSTRDCAAEAAQLQSGMPPKPAESQGSAPSLPPSLEAPPPGPAPAR